MKRIFWILGLAVCLMAVFWVAGCDKTELPVEPTDEVVVDQPVDDGVLTADEINAIGREQHKLFLENGGTLPQHDGDKAWQLYVNVPFYSQRDLNWGDINLGWSTLKIRDFGCHLSCISMHYAKWGYTDMSPPQLNNWAKSNNGFSGPELIASNAIDYGRNRNVRYISSNQIYSELQAGRPVIVRIRYGNGSHFMIIFAFDGQRFWVKDPLRDWTQQSQPLYGDAYPETPFRVYGP